MSAEECVGQDRFVGKICGGARCDRASRFHKIDPVRDPQRLARFLLDEPVGGMNQDEAKEIRTLLIELRGRGVTILLIEHDMPFVMNLCEYLYVLDFGVLIAQGEPASIRRDARVLDAYLGTQD